MIASVFIEPHERREATEAYADWLTAEQRDEIADAPDGALIRLHMNLSGKACQVLVIPEG